MAVPNIFGSATSAIPLSQLDTNFATPVTIGNTAVQLGNTVTSFGNVTLTNVTISSGNVTVTSPAIFPAGTAALPSITTSGDTNTGIFFPAADTIAFSEGGVEAARFDSAGNFGLGVTPSAWASGTYKALQIFGGGAVSGSSGQLNLSQNFVGESGGEKYIATAAATSYSQVAGSHRWYNAPSGTAGNAISFTQAMTLDASGNLGLGVTSIATPSANRRGFQISNSTSGAAIFLSNFATEGDNPRIFSNIATQYDLGFVAGGSTGFINFYTNGTERAKIDSSGNFYVNTMAVGGTANLHWSSGAGQFFVTSSSRRFKHDIVDYDKGLTELMQMQPKYFVYNDEPNQKQRAGFIAEDFHDLGMTEYVEYWKDDEGNDTPSEIGYSNMVAILVKSIQEQQALITQLTARITALEGA